MPTSPSITEQLTALGIPLPAWPAEPEGDSTTDDLIQRGQAYAEGIRLWRAQLRRVAALDGEGRKRLTTLLHDLGRQSDWDQGIVRYLLADLRAGGTYECVHAAAKLVVANTHTPGQQLGSALVLARDGLLVSSLEAFKQLLEAHQPSAINCFELCALLVDNLPASLGADDEEGAWLQGIDLHHQASRVLVAAASTVNGEQNSAGPTDELRALYSVAATGRLEPERNERAAIEEARIRKRRQQTRPPGKPLLRTIHHLACTGGTVISKCLTAMPDVALISEVNPFNRHGSEFEPTNPLLLLERDYRPLNNDEIIKGFSQQILHAHQICKRDDVDLVIRDHSHSDFCMGTEPSEKCPIVDYLAEEYELLSVLTVRHPLDSYQGLLAQGWHKQFTPGNLNEYCRRYLAFLDRYSHLPTLRYEDFCSSPKPFMKNLCNILQISYTECFLGRYGQFRLTGDSGRSGIKSIAQRPRRQVTEQLRAEIDSTDLYAELLQRLGY